MGLVESAGNQCIKIVADYLPKSSTIAYHLVSAAEDCIVIVLHNHPSLSDFSLSDVQFFQEKMMAFAG